MRERERDPKRERERDPKRERERDPEREREKERERDHRCNGYLLFRAYKPVVIIKGPAGIRKDSREKSFLKIKFKESKMKNFGLQESSSSYRFRWTKLCSPS